MARKKRVRSDRYAGQPEQWVSARKDRCEICDARGSYTSLHHVVYEQHVRDAGGDVWDPRNSLTVCDGPFSCHTRHHSRMRPIRLDALPDSAYEFAAELFGSGAAYEYLRRRYFGDDPRLDRLLDEWEMAA